MGDWDVVSQRPIVLKAGNRDVLSTNIVTKTDQDDWGVVGQRDALMPSHQPGNMMLPPSHEQSSMGPPTSAITGQPFPSDAEQIKMGANALRTAGPIAGDIALTAFAPQFQLPAKAGMLMRGLAGTGNLATRAAAAAAGTGLPAKLAEMMGADNSQMSAEGEMGLAAAGEALPTAVGLPLKLAGKAVRFGTDLIGNVGVFGGTLRRMLSTARDGAVSEASDNAIKFLEDVAPDIVKNQDAGTQHLGIRIAKAMGDNGGVYDLYKEALKVAGEKNSSNLVPIGDTHRMLTGLKDSIGKRLNEAAKRGEKEDTTIINATLKEMGFTPSSGFELKRILEFGNNLATPDQIEFILATVYKGYHGLSPTRKALREELKDALLKDMGKIAEGGGVSVEGLKKKADDTFKVIKRFEFVKTLYERSSKKIDDAGGMQIIPLDLAENIYNSKKKIIKEMPELWPRLEKQAEYYIKMAPQFKEIKSDTAYGLVESLGVVMPDATQAAKDTIGAALMFGQQVAKPAMKTGLHLGGQEIGF